MICLQEVKKYCEEYWKIENYEEAVNDQTQTWHCHHRHEIDWALPREELIAIGRYYDVHYSELIFLTPEEHNRLHKSGENHPMYGKQLSEETKGKIREALKGRNLTKETKQKMSDAMKGKNKGNQHSLKYIIDKEELYDLYVVQGLSQTQIAKMYNCCYQTILYKLKKYNIKK